jgi:hypothetical protein
VYVPPLRDAFASLPIGWQRVSLYDRHPLVRFGQYPRGQQAAHTGAENHGVLADLSHRCFLSV